MRIYTHYNMEIVRLRTASASAPALMSTRNTPENPPLIKTTKSLFTFMQFILKEKKKTSGYHMVNK